MSESENVRFLEENRGLQLVFSPENPISNILLGFNFANEILSRES